MNLAAAAAGVVLASCGDDEAAKNAGSSAGGETDQAQVEWNWDAFPQSSEMVLNTMPLDIQPKESFEIQSEAAGIITLEVDRKVTQVEKEQVIARMNVDTLAEQGERLTIQQERKILEEMKAENLELPEQRKKAKEELDEARRKVRMIEMILKNPAMEEYANELFGGSVGDLNDKSLQEAQDALRLAEAKMTWAEEYGEKIRAGEQRIQEMDMAKTQRQYEETKERSVYTAPFAGELQLEVNFVAGQNEYTVATRETFATLSDYAEIHGHLKVGNAAWINMPPQQLYVELKDRNGTIMNFKEDRMIKDPRAQRQERIYVFFVPIEGNEELKRLVGTQMNADLVFRLPSRCYIVPKYDLSLYSLGKTDDLEWSTMVASLWPGAELIAEGRKDLAISYRPQAGVATQPNP